jgi:ribonuclease-3
MNKINKLYEILSEKTLNSDLFINSLTHRSASSNNNERLEFLGDAVLGLVIANHLYSSFKNDQEGILSRKRSHLVKKDTLFRIAKKLSLSDLINIGEGEKKSGGKNSSSILSDALEAIIGVVFLIDGYDAAKEFILKVYQEELENIPDDEELKDSKTKLQEFLQGKGFNLPKYETKEVLIEKDLHFETTCHVKELKIEEKGVGKNKRLSQQTAASKVLNNINK